MHDRSRFGTRDALLAFAAFAVTCGYLWSLPPVLMPSDEANYLHEAKRVAEGEVLYRDVFELTTPGWIYLVAILYRVFGTTITTAKGAAAVIHGITAATLFLTCRAVGVRRVLSWPVSLLYVVVSVSAWPLTSQHWLATMLSVVLVLAGVLTRGAPARWRIVPGIALGLLVATHQRGVVLGTGIAIWLLADELLSAHDRGKPWASRLLAPVGWYVLGSLAVLGPLAAYLLASAGVDPVWRALIVHPLFNYRAGLYLRWGRAGVTAPFTFPILLKYAPVVLIVPVLRVVRLLWLETRARLAEREEEASVLLLLVTAGAAAIVSILYYPDIIHIAFIAPLLLVALAESVEWAARAGPASGRLLRGAGYGTVVVLLLATAVQLHRNRRSWQKLFPRRQETAFGRIAVNSPIRVEQYEHLERLVREAPERTLFGYPVSASHLCLMTGARNPMRFEFMSISYNTPDQLEEVLATLRDRPPAYVILTAKLGPRDPVGKVLDQYYDVFFAARGLGQFTILKPREHGAQPSSVPGG